jgi:hypothetical protein
MKMPWIVMLALITALLAPRAARAEDPSCENFLAGDWKYLPPIIVAVRDLDYDAVAAVIRANPEEINKNYCFYRQSPRRLASSLNSVGWLLSHHLTNRPERLEEEKRKLLRVFNLLVEKGARLDGYHLRGSYYPAGTLGLWEIDALALAMAFNHEEIVDRLMELGLNPNAVYWAKPTYPDTPRKAMTPIAFGISGGIWNPNFHWDTSGKFKGIKRYEGAKGGMSSYNCPLAVKVMDKYGARILLPGTKFDAYAIPFEHIARGLAEHDPANNGEFLKRVLEAKP